ncbi:hypothetical protein EG329_006052 [Mollisiaceae sp. DMI_Dod_QoI]|nr:hypothetical protein EG329_006052 [Helotiales sp. DMI_Dod_QoI]
MAQPQAKKQKTNNAPIVFTLRKAKPDVRFFVFDQEYHVYSAVLKVGSEFFQKYLEPSGGIAPTSTSPLFRSDWYTDVEDDGSWHLSSDVSIRQKDASRFKGDKEREQKAFNNLLCVIFSREYQITDAAELNSMTEQADYYRALPVMSNTLGSAFLNSPGLLSTIGHDPCAVLVSAYKLRHKMLFREALILSLGPWSEPRYENELKNFPLLHNVAGFAYMRHNAKVQELWSDLLQLATNKLNSAKGVLYGGSALASSVFAGAEANVDSSNKVMLPSLLRSTFDAANMNDYYRTNDAFTELLSPFLKSNLVLNKAAQAGKDNFKAYFLCFEIQDEELPWDLNQVDW